MSWTPWFIWRGEDCRDKGIFLYTLPQIIRGKEKIVSHDIPGRAGALTIAQGEDVYEQYIKTFTVGLPWDADPQRVLSWLRGSGEIIFSNEPKYRYFGRIINQVNFDKLGRGWEMKTGTVQIMVQPYKGQYPEESAISLTGFKDVLNPGDVTARPLFEVQSATATIATEKGTLTGLVEGVKVDCETGILTDSTGALYTDAEGEMPLLPTGKSTIEVTGTVKMLPRWRWI